jgi:hypothetical protein
MGHYIMLINYTTMSNQSYDEGDAFIRQYMEQERSRQERSQLAKTTRVSTNSTGVVFVHCSKCYAPVCAQVQSGRLQGSSEYLCRECRLFVEQFR